MLIMKAVNEIIFVLYPSLVQVFQGKIDFFELEIKLFIYECALLERFNLENDIAEVDLAGPKCYLALLN